MALNVLPAILFPKRKKRSKNSLFVFETDNNLEPCYRRCLFSVIEDFTIIATGLPSSIYEPSPNHVIHKSPAITLSHHRVSSSVKSPPPDECIENTQTYSKVDFEDVKLEFAYVTDTSQVGLSTSPNWYLRVTKTTR
jgi:hypothetical protein